MPKETLLRDYQLEMLDRLHLAWEQHQSVMVQMPTGVGKTILLAEEIKNEKLKIKNDKGGVLVVAHRIELIDQISRTLDKFGIEHGLIVSGKSVDVTKRVQVASIQTLTKKIKNERLKIKNEELAADTMHNGSSDFSSQCSGAGGTLFTFNFSLIIIDEAHHALAKTYKMLWDKWPEARFLGLTATPCRMSGQGFTDLFDTLLQG